MASNSALEIQFSLRPRPARPRARAEVAPETRPQARAGRLPQITRVLALAIHFDEMLRREEARDYADIGRLSCLCRERVSQIMRLNYLVPEIQVELLYLSPVSGGRYPISETAMRGIAGLLSWAEQRREWARLKRLHRLD